MNFESESGGGYLFSNGTLLVKIMKNAFVYVIPGGEVRAQLLSHDDDSMELYLFRPLQEKYTFYRGELDIGKWDRLISNFLKYQNLDCNPQGLRL